MLKDFGIRIKEARLEKRMSQKSLGLSLGLSDKTISAYEAGRSFPTLDVLEKISQVLGKEIDFFVCKTGGNGNIYNKMAEILSLQEEIQKKLLDLENTLRKEE